MSFSEASRSTNLFHESSNLNWTNRFLLMFSFYKFGQSASIKDILFKLLSLKFNTLILLVKSTCRKKNFNALFVMLMSVIFNTFFRWFLEAYSKKSFILSSWSLRFKEISMSIANLKFVFISDVLSRYLCLSFSGMDSKYWMVDCFVSP